MSDWRPFTPPDRPDPWRWMLHTGERPREVKATMPLLRLDRELGAASTRRPRPHTYYYRVLGLPIGHYAKIAEVDGAWRVLRIVDGRQGEWDGHYATPEDALAVLAALYESTR